MINKKTFKQPDMDSNIISELSLKLLKANEDLNKAKEQQKNMLENISHDLRAPLTAIRSTIDYIKQFSKSEFENLSVNERQNLINVLDMRTKTLEVLVQDLYCLTCLDSGSAELKFKEVPIAQFLEEYFFAVEIDDKFEGAELCLNIPENLDAVVRIDIAKMERVLDNIFSNARKYSDLDKKKKLKIALGAYTIDNNVCIYIKDNGQGIPADAIPFIFDRTYRVNSCRTPEHETSSGLGLSIAKSIVVRHGGSIKCESVVGEGSCFSIWLPIIS